MLTLRKNDGDHAFDWIPLQIAAQRIGCNAENLARRCRKELAPAKLAIKRGSVWLISPVADPRLRDRVDEKQRDLQQEAQLAAMAIDPKYIFTARHRRDLIVAFEAFVPAAHLTLREERESFLTTRSASEAAPDDVPSITTFYTWIAAYQADGLRGLIPQHAYRARSDSAAGDSALDYIERLLNCGNGVPLRSAIEIARDEAMRHADDPSWRIASYSSIRIEIKKRRPKIMRILAGKGPRAAKADCVPKMQRHFESISAGDEYVGDERTLDIWCRVFTSRGWRAVRPKWTVWMDMRSRVIVGSVLAAHASSRTILGALKRGIAFYGKPRLLRTDWGEDYRKAARHGEYRDFDGTRIGNILDDLGITVQKVARYSPYAKPIESFFRTNKGGFDRLHESFWGGCPSERHEDRSKYIKDHLEKLPTLEQIEATLAKWIEVYHHTPHGAPDLFGKTPLEAMAVFRAEPIRRESEQVLNHLFQEFVGPKLVRRDGVKHNGHWYGNGDARLVAMPEGTKVLLAIQPDEQGRAMVCDLQRKPLFLIECLPISGLTHEQLSARCRDNRRLLRPYAEQVRRGRDLILSTSPDEILSKRLKRIKRNGAIPDAPPSLTIARPALEQALATAGPSPSDGAESKAVRTGTDDDDIGFDDLLSPSPFTAQHDEPEDFDDE